MSSPTFLLLVTLTLVAVLHTINASAPTGSHSPNVCPPIDADLPPDYRQADASRIDVNPSATTRSVIVPHSFALLAPDSRVYAAPPPGWTGTITAATVITPALGAHFSMYLGRATAGAELQNPVTYPHAPSRLERLVYVLNGRLTLRGTDGTSDVSLQAGGFVYIAPEENRLSLHAIDNVAFIQIDRIYSGNGGAKSTWGHENDRPTGMTDGEMFRLKKLLDPTDPTLDFNIHIMDFSPGESLVVKEVHYNQHGLLMLAGHGLYRLGERYFPVAAGDVIYMAPFVPQWYVALAPGTTRYWLYKDTNVNPLLSP